MSDGVLPGCGHSRVRSSQVPVEAMQTLVGAVPNKKDQRLRFSSAHACPLGPRRTLRQLHSGPVITDRNRPGKNE